MRVPRVNISKQTTDGRLMSFVWRDCWGPASSATANPRATEVISWLLIGTHVYETDGDEQNSTEVCGKRASSSPEETLNVIARRARYTVSDILPSTYIPYWKVLYLFGGFQHLTPDGRLVKSSSQGNRWTIIKALMGLTLGSLWLL